ncbi:hypothetical protein OO184_04960, partial [Photorhabdus sp. APURE]|uniref:hypothetical protein n=1 Tax=Photorhabdus aballayi TaxID=2991723 RepID=UPI00223E18B6
MKDYPLFPPYCQASPPCFKRWLGVGAGLVLLTSNIVALIRPEVGDISALYALIPGLAALWLLCLLFRVLFYRFARHNAWTYEQQVERVQQQWWRKHCQQIALVDYVLVGPLGSTPDVWLKVINQLHCRPKPIREKSGLAVRLSCSFVSDIEQREIQLAKMVVNKWQGQRQEPLKCTPLRCYWLGSAAAWQGFATQMAERFPDVELPEQPQPWLGLDTLDEMIDLLNTTKDKQATILCAGCQCVDSEAESALPAGEAAFIWLLKKQGNVCFTRGEFFCSQSDEEVVDVAAR